MLCVLLGLLCLKLDFCDQASARSVITDAIPRFSYYQVYRRRYKSCRLPSPNCIRKKITAKNNFQYGGWNSSPLRNFDQIAVICVIFWIKFPNFVQIRPPAAEQWRHIGLQFQDGGRGGCIILLVSYLMISRSWYSEEGPGRVRHRPVPSSLYQRLYQPIHQRPVYHFHITRRDTVIAFAL